MKTNDEESSSSSAGSAAVLRPWSDLPGLVLLSILRRLLSPADALAFSSACRAWRSVSIQESILSPSSSSSPRPPLLLLPVLGPTHRRTRTRGWRRPLRCLIRSFDPGDPSPYRCMASPAALAGSFLGFSYGFLLSLSADDPQRLLLVNVFTGDELRPPPLPVPSRHVYHGLLAAPPASPCGLFLLLFTSHTPASDLLTWRPGDAGWTSSPGLPSIHHVAAVGGRVYALDHCGGLFVVRLEPRPGLEPLEVLHSPHSLPVSLPFTPLGRQLVGCCGELLMVSFAEERMMAARIDVHRMDFLRSAWVKVENLGDCSLFLDLGGKSPVACVEPSRWGGRSNCIYLIGPGCDSASIFPLDGSPIDMIMQSPLCPTNFCLPSWPSPIWVIPSLLPASHGVSDLVS